MLQELSTATFSKKFGLVLVKVLYSKFPQLPKNTKVEFDVSIVFTSPPRCFQAKHRTTIFESKSRPFENRLICENQSGSC